MNTNATVDMDKYLRADGRGYDLTDGQGAYAGTAHCTILRMHADFGTFSVDASRMVRVVPARPMVDRPETAGGFRTLDEALAFAAGIEATWAVADAERAQREEDERLGRWVLDGRPVLVGRTYGATTRYGGYNRVTYTYADTQASGSMPAGKFWSAVRCRRCGKSVRACKCEEAG